MEPKLFFSAGVNYPFYRKSLQKPDYTRFSPLSQKMLKSTGDSSTACSTLVAELHNPHINTDFCNGNNLHIASPEHGVIHIAEYAARVLGGEGDN